MRNLHLLNPRMLRKPSQTTHNSISHTPSRRRRHRGPQPVQVQLRGLLVFIASATVGHLPRGSLSLFRGHGGLDTIATNDTHLSLFLLGRRRRCVMGYKWTHTSMRYWNA